MKTCRTKKKKKALQPLPSCNTYTQTETPSQTDQNVHRTEHLHLLISRNPPKSALTPDIQTAFRPITAKPSWPAWCPCKEETPQPGWTHARHCLQGAHHCQRGDACKTQPNNYIQKRHQEFRFVLGCIYRTPPCPIYRESVELLRRRKQAANVFRSICQYISGHKEKEIHTPSVSGKTQRRPLLRSTHFYMK